MKEGNVMQMVMPRFRTHAGGKAESVSEFVPRSLIAGSLPVAAGASPLHVAYNAASFALDTDRICLITSVQGDKVHYLAGAASDFASQGPVSTLLARALPGVAGHQGKGVYFCTTEDDVKCFVGDQGDADRFPDAEGLDDYVVHRLQPYTEKLTGLPAWKPFSERDRAANRAWCGGLLVTGIGLSVVMALIWAGSAIYVSRLGAPRPDPAQELQSLIAQTSASVVKDSGTYDSAWLEFQTVSRFVLEHQGKLLSFQLLDGKLSWSLEVPDSVTGEELDQALGRGIQTRRDGGKISVGKNKEKR
jgi:hypothetical protein